MNQLFIYPLLAGLGEVLGSLILLLMLVLWVVSQIMEAKKQLAPRDRVPAPPQPAMEGEARPVGQQADPLRNQVDEFLRRAGRKPQGAAPRGARAGQPSEIEVLVPDERPTRDRPRLAEPLRPIEQRPSTTASPQAGQSVAVKQVVRPRPPQRPAAKPRESVAEHVAEHVRAHTAALGEQASRLGQRIVQEDEQFDIQLKAKFDHTVGTLAGSRASAPVETDVVASETPAAQIAAMLASPEGVRQAIVINEILRRPTDRW